MSQKSFRNHILLGTLVFFAGVVFIVIGSCLKPGPCWNFWFDNGYGMTVTLKKFAELSDRSKVIVDGTANTIRFLGSTVDIPILASSKYGKRPSYVVYGLINPTIEVEKDSILTVELVNTDLDSYHGFIVVSAKPPYSYLPIFFHSNAFRNAIIPAVGHGKNGDYRIFETKFRADSSGIFYYICQVPGCASSGMYGKLIVGNPPKKKL